MAFGVQVFCDFRIGLICEGNASCERSIAIAARGISLVQQIDNPSSFI